uniref:Uncharacterized protein n=1 Tax=Ditylenchus dipsaci TaxID=166011 RepID=A0A915ENB5_9BILA
MDRHLITETVERVQEDYAALVRAKNEYSQYLNRLKSFNSQHEDNLMSVNRWLSELERSITHTGLNPVDTEARLAQLLQLKQSTVESQHKLDKFKQTAQQLVDATAGTEAHEQMQVEQQGQLNQVYKRYEALSNRIDEGVNSARAEITEKEDSAESKLLSVQPLPLNQTELNDLKYEDQLKRSELTSKAKTLDDLSQLLRRMRLTSPTLNQLEEKGIEDSLNSTQQRFNKLNTTVNGLSHNLLDLISSLDQFHSKQSEMGVEQASLTEAIANLETTDQKALAEVEDRLAKLVNDDWPALEKYAKRVGILVYLIKNWA